MSIGCWKPEFGTSARTACDQLLNCLSSLSKQHCSLQGLQQGEADGYVPPLATLHLPVEMKLPLSTRQISPHPVTQACGVFRRQVMPSNYGG